jgi:hypothetical protein
MAERAIMSKKKNNGIADANITALNYPHPYFVPIDDGDEATIKYYKNFGVPVTRIAFPGRMPHYYAVFNAETQEEANMMKRVFNALEKKDARAKSEQVQFEVESYDVMVENGYDVEREDSNPEEIVVYKAVMDALYEKLNTLTEEKLRICRMEANHESQRSVAEEMCISRRTLRDHREDLFSELHKLMKDFR